MYDSKTGRRANLTRTGAGWFLAGVTFAGFLIATQARALGGLGGLLLVGNDSALRPFIEALLPGVPLVNGSGHDGQIYYAMAHDLDGDVVAQWVLNPGIRFRRPILPVLSSMFGLLEGRAVLWSTAAWISIGFGVSAMAMRDLTRHFRVDPRWTLALFIYPGFWMATRLFTPDMIALAAALGGVAMYLRGRTSLSITLFVLAALTKEAFLVIALATGAWAFFKGHRLKGLVTAGVPLVAVSTYAAIVIARFDVEAIDGNFGLPFTGLLRARDEWALTTPSDRMYIYLTILVLGASVIVLMTTREPLLRWLIAPWPLIGVVSSEWIWRVGNGTLRSFAPVVLFMALAIGVGMRDLEHPSDHNEVAAPTDAGRPDPG